ncbi:LysR family transcriptional regulator, glycine cleavage system transcriptional activator [Massilia sp. PDC64]|nr:LysR substrate-binding domain-containing protein [Massilia sp. PDC64]SDD05874.1 LysR family transcriptional regulator, glycine cleavage system transcriptional activator [Massilia sp. PDC64]
MSRIPLGYLPTFIAAARLQNFRLAGESLGLTHSAVSQQIAALEARLGFQVFDRVGRGILLNAAGKALLHGVAPALDAIRESVHAAGIAARTEGRTLRITMIPSFAQRWFMPRLGNWYARHPDIRLDIETSNGIVDLLREGFHAGIRTGNGPWPGLVAEPLHDRPARLIATGAPAAARRLDGQPPAAVAAEALLGDPDLWAGWFGAAGVDTRVTTVAQFNDLSLMLQAAEQGLGLALTDDVLAADALRAGRLMRLFDVAFESAAASSHRLVYPAVLQDWPAIHALRAWLRAEFEASFLALQDAC